MANYMEEAFAPIEARNRAMVFADTWGHLAPNKNHTYKCTMLVAKSDWDSIGVNLIQVKWHKNEMEDSPWIFDAMNDFISSLKLETGIYLVECTFRNFRWWSKQTKFLSIN